MTKNQPYTQNLRIASHLHHIVMVLDRGADHLLLENLRMSFVQVMILMIVQKLGTLNQKEIVRWLGITPGAVSRQLDSLVREGCVTREEHPKNRRQHAISLTEAGIARLNEAIALLDRSLDHVFSDISADERSVLEKILHKLVVKLEPSCLSYQFSRNIKTDGDSPRQESF